MTTQLAATQITLNLLQGSVRFNFSAAAAQELKAALINLANHLKSSMGQASSESKQPPVPAMEYRHTGDVFLEVFCNPNIWPSPFAAKLLITVRDDRIRLTTEAELPRILEDINEYLDNA